MTKEELLKVSKPILFNTEMVQAILDGRKTVTRRKIKLDLGLADMDKTDNSYLKIPDEYGDCHDAKDLCRYRVGDIIYVRETWKEYEKRVGKGENTHIEKLIGYKADEANADNPSEFYEGNWKPSIHMRKDLARILLKVTDVRVERLQDIGVQQMKREGLRLSTSGVWDYVDYLEMFHKLWNSTIKISDLDKYSWESNPFVWVIEFERVVPE